MMISYYAILFILIITTLAQQDILDTPCYTIYDQCLNYTYHKRICKPVLNFWEEPGTNKLQNFQFIKAVDPKMVIEVFPAPNFNGAKYLEGENEICLPYHSYHNRVYSIKVVQDQCAYIFSECEFSGTMIKVCKNQFINILDSFKPFSILMLRQNGVALWGPENEFALFSDTNRCINWSLYSSQISQFNLLKKAQIINKGVCVILYSIVSFNGESAAICQYQHNLKEESKEEVIGNWNAWVNGVQSVKIPTGFTIIIFEKKNYTGNNITIYYDEKNLLRKIGSIGSMKIFPADKNCVYGYEQCDFQGRRQILCGGHRWIGYEKQSKLKSFRFEGQYAVNYPFEIFLYAKPEYEKLLFRGQSLDCANFTKNISSILILPVNVTAPQTPEAEQMDKQYELLQKIKDGQVFIDQVQESDNKEWICLKLRFSNNNESNSNAQHTASYHAKPQQQITNQNIDKKDDAPSNQHNQTNQNDNPIKSVNVENIKDVNDKKTQERNVHFASDNEELDYQGVNQKKQQIVTLSAEEEKPQQAQIQKIKIEQQQQSIEQPQQQVNEQKKDEQKIQDLSVSVTKKEESITVEIQNESTLQQQSLNDTTTTTIIYKEQSSTIQDNNNTNSSNNQSEVDNQLEKDQQKQIQVITILKDKDEDIINNEEQNQNLNNLDNQENNDTNDDKANVKSLSQNKDTQGETNNENSIQQNSIQNQFISQKIEDIIKQEDKQPIPIQMVTNQKNQKQNYLLPLGQEQKNQVIESSNSIIIDEPIDQYIIQNEQKIDKQIIKTEEINKINQNSDHQQLKKLQLKFINQSNEQIINQNIQNDKQKESTLDLNSDQYKSSTLSETQDKPKHHNKVQKGVNYPQNEANHIYNLKNVVDDEQQMDKQQPIANQDHIFFSENQQTGNTKEQLSVLNNVIESSQDEASIKNMFILNSKDDDDTNIQQENFQIDNETNSEKCITFFEKCNFQGKSEVFCNPTKNIGNWIGKVKSVKIPNGMKLTLFNQVNYKGDKLILIQSESCLQNKNIQQFIQTASTNDYIKFGEENSEYEKLEEEHYTMPHSNKKQYLKRNFRMNRLNRLKNPNYNDDAKI